MSGTRSIESRQLYRAVPDAVTELGPEEDDLGRESRCGAVALGRTYLLPPLSSGGALLVRPWLRFHIPLIEPEWRIARIRLSDKTSRLHPRQAATKLGQAYEAEVLVKGV